MFCHIGFFVDFQLMDRGRLVCGAASGCADGTTASNATTANKPSATNRTVDPQNTAVNVRDRSEAAKTPFDQNENSNDIRITADIRKGVVATKMSSNAHNVKIITQDGLVTLRGPVTTAKEKQTIEEIAKKVAGVTKVDSQLEVTN